MAEGTGVLPGLAAVAGKPLPDLAEPPYLPPWRPRTPLLLVIRLRATESYTSPTVYTAPANPIRRSGELSRLVDPEALPPLRASHDQLVKPCVQR